VSFLGWMEKIIHHSKEDEIDEEEDINNLLKNQRG
jgi:hypothetical protein